jgi:hypothetical protein
VNDEVRLAPVAAYNSKLEADLVVARLQTAGIGAHVWSDGLGGAFPGMPMATGGFQVMVAESDRQLARDTVLEMGGQAINPASGQLDSRSWELVRWLVPALGGLIVLAALLRFLN